MNDFSSIDKLVEFGLSLAVAQQMIATVNHSINNMDIPGVHNPITNSKETTYFVVLDGKQSGPYDEAKMMEFIHAGKITPQTLVWKPGLSSWRTAEDICEINRLFLLASSK